MFQSEVNWSHVVKCLAITGMESEKQLSGEEPNKKRRYFLVGATSAVGAVGVGFAATPFVKSWNPSAKAKAAGAPVRIDISKLNPGEILGPIPAWRGQPVFIVYRTQASIDKLSDTKDSVLLADPSSQSEEQQPLYARNPWRSRRPEIGVYLGLCTHLGCSPKFHGKVQAESFDPNWQGGFFCPCHGSKFDLAGRVEKNMPAPENLKVPPYSFETENIIVVGLDEETS